MIIPVVVLYKTPKKIVERLLSDLKKIGIPKKSVILISNTEKNRGFAAAVNIGIKRAVKMDPSTILIINPDIQLTHVTRKNIVATQKQFSIFGGVINQKKRTYYGGTIDKWYMSGGLSTIKPSGIFSNTDFVSGSFMGISPTCIKEIGYLKENYFMYYEDVEYCVRAKGAGFSVGISTSLQYNHTETSETKFPEKKYYLVKNRLLFLHEYGTLLQKVREFIKMLAVFPFVNGLEKKGYIDFYLSHVRQTFLKNFSLLNISSLLNRVMNFVFVIFLVRTIPQTDFGIYTLIWAHMGILQSWQDLGTTSFGILQSEEKNKVQLLNNIFSLRLFFSLFVSVGTILLAFLFRYPLPVIGTIAALSIIYFSNAVTGFFMIVSSLSKELITSSVVGFSINLLRTVGGILVLYYSHSVYVFLYFASFVYAVHGISTYLLIYTKHALTITFSYKTALYILKQSLIFTFISFCASLYSKIDHILLRSISGVAVLAIYGAAYKFYEVAQIVIPSYNFSSVPIFRTLYVKNKKKYRKKIITDSVLVLLLSGAIVISTLVLAKPLVLMFLSKTYAQAIPLLHILIFALPFILLTSVYLNALYAMQLRLMALFSFGFLVVINVVANYLLIPRFGATAAAYVTVFSEVFNTLFFGSYLWFKLRNDKRSR